MKGSRKVIFLAATAAVFNGLFIFSGMLSAGWAIVISTLLSSVIVEAVMYIRNRGGLGADE